MKQSEYFSREELNRRLATLADHLQREVANLDPEDDDHDRAGAEETQRILWKVLHAASELASKQVQAHYRDDDQEEPKVPRSMAREAEFAYGVVRAWRDIGRHGVQAGRN